MRNPIDVAMVDALISVGEKMKAEYAEYYSGEVGVRETPSTIAWDDTVALARRLAGNESRIARPVPEVVR